MASSQNPQLKMSSTLIELHPQYNAAKHLEPGTLFVVALPLFNAVDHGMLELEGNTRKSC